MKKFFAIMLSLVFCLCACAAVRRDADRWPQRGIRPFEYVDDNGEIAGFDVDLINAMAEKMGMEVEIEDMYFDGLLGGAQQRYGDCPHHRHDHH